MPFSTHSIPVSQQRSLELPLLLSLPVSDDASQPQPLILFLHGMGERGQNLELLKLHGLPRLLAEGRQFPAIIAAPQCPADSHWTHELASLHALLDHLESSYPIDPARIYITGLSMGGYGSWWLAQSRPTRFAAIAPICGGGDLWRAGQLRDMPVWAFHGEDDDVVSVQETIRMVEALRAAGNQQVKMTLYPGIGHNSWDAAYANPDLYDWLFAQRKESPQ